MDQQIATHQDDPLGRCTRHVLDFQDELECSIGAGHRNIDISHCMDLHDAAGFYPEENLPIHLSESSGGCDPGRALIIPTLFRRVK